MANRDLTIDIGKGIAIILMCVGHRYVCTFLDTFIYLFHMAFFFMMRGYFFREKNLANPKTSYSSSVYDRLEIVPKKGYVCSGVLMLNLDYWRQHSIAEQVLDYGKKYPEKTLFPNQDAINVIC